MPTSSNLMSHLIWPMLGLVGVLFVLAGLLWWVRARLRDSSDDDGCSPLFLAEYREMVSRGELNEEDYRQIKDGLIARMGVGSPPSAVSGKDRLRRVEARPVEPDHPVEPAEEPDRGEEAEEE